MDLVGKVQFFEDNTYFPESVVSWSSFEYPKDRVSILCHSIEDEAYQGFGAPQCPQISSGLMAIFARKKILLTGNEENLTRDL